MGNRTSYRQVRDILEGARTFHRTLADRFEGLSNRAEDERFEALLEYMGRHEKNLHDYLSRYEKDAADALLDMWLQYVPENEVQPPLEKLQAKADEMSACDIVETAMAFDNALIDLYRQLAESTQAPRVQELFANLLEMTQGKESQFAWTLQNDFDGHTR
jgi:hypothetical protein